jgi:hypothetical protein
MSAADGWPGVAAEDEDEAVAAVAIDGLPVDCVDPPFGCRASAEPVASTSAFPSSDIAASAAALANSFVSVISPIYKKRGTPIRDSDL